MTTIILMNALIFFTFNVKKINAVEDNLSSCKKKTWKIQAYQDSNPDLGNPGAVL